MINLNELLHSPFLVFVIAVFSCCCFYFLQKKENRFRKITWVLYAFILVSVFFIFMNTVYKHIFDPTIYDFTVFYMYGKVGISGGDLYSPAVFHSVFNTLTLPVHDYGIFHEEILSVGFLYPPPTIWLFDALGFFSFTTASVCWTSFNLLFAGGCMYLVYKMFFEEYKTNGLFLVLILFMLSAQVRSTVAFGQTNFILFFLLLLMYRYANKSFAGIFLALAFIVKPFMIIFGVIFLIRKQWKTIIYFLATYLVFVIPTLIRYGIKPFYDYIFDSPGKRLPDWIFSDTNNESLNAVLIRRHLVTVHDARLYTIVAAAILLLTCWYIITLCKAKLFDCIWAILLLVGLLLYPGTLSYYGTLLLFISFKFFDKDSPLSISNRYVNTLAVGICYFLGSASVFALICVLIGFIIFKSIQVRRQPALAAYGYKTGMVNNVN